MNEGKRAAVPPHSIEAEEYLISTVLLDETGQAFGMAQQVGIKPAAFYSPSNRLIWEKIEAVYKRGAVCDLGLLGLELQDSKQLDEVGGWAFLSQVSGRVGTTAQVREFAERVKLLWETRHACTVASKFCDELLANCEGRDTFLKLAGELGQKLIRLGRRSATKSLAEIYSSVSDEMRDRANGKVDTSKWVYTGIDRFDELCRPMNSRRADGFVILAGGSGDGKTTGMCQIGVANLKLGKRVLVISREIDTAGFIEKGISSELSIDLNGLETLPKQDQERFEKECKRQESEWAGKRLWCIDQDPNTPIFTVEDVCEAVRAHVHLHGIPELILIDYLQIFDARKRIVGGSREAMVAYVSHTFQALQRELGCVVIVGSQLNEKGLSEMRETKNDDSGAPKFRMPNRGDLRESQAAYHDADRVIFLFRPPVDASGMDQHAPGLTSLDVWWYQEKRRAGCTGYAVTRFERRFCRFVQVGHKVAVHPTLPDRVASRTLPDKAKFIRN